MTAAKSAPLRGARAQRRSQTFHLWIFASIELIEPKRRESRKNQIDDKRHRSDNETRRVAN
jgi:hypothetical protein